MAETAEQIHASAHKHIWDGRNTPLFKSVQQLIATAKRDIIADSISLELTDRQAHMADGGLLALESLNSWLEHYSTFDPKDQELGDA